MDRWVTLRKRVTSPIWGPLPTCKQKIKNKKKFKFKNLKKVNRPKEKRRTASICFGPTSKCLWILDGTLC